MSWSWLLIRNLPAITDGNTSDTMRRKDDGIGILILNILVVVSEEVERELAAMMG